MDTVKGVDMVFVLKNILQPFTMQALLRLCIWSFFYSLFCTWKENWPCHQHNNETSLAEMQNLCVYNFVTWKQNWTHFSEKYDENRESIYWWHAEVKFLQPLGRLCKIFASRVNLSRKQWAFNNMFCKSTLHTPNANFPHHKERHLWYLFIHTVFFWVKIVIIYAFFCAIFFAWKFGHVKVWTNFMSYDKCDQVPQSLLSFHALTDW